MTTGSGAGWSPRGLSWCAVPGGWRGNGRATSRVPTAPRGGGGRAPRGGWRATGRGPGTPPVPGLREAGPWDNRAITSAKEVPRRLLVLGGGAIGAEMAQACKRLGSENVVVLEGAERLLAREEPFAGEELRAAFEAEGITVVTASPVTGVRPLGPDGPLAPTV